MLEKELLLSRCKVSGGRLKKTILTLTSAVLAMFLGTAAHAARTVNFDPENVPSKGPDDAAVTVIEIASYT